MLLLQRNIVIITLYLCNRKKPDMHPALLIIGTDYILICYSFITAIATK